MTGSVGLSGLISLLLLLVLYCLPACIAHTKDHHNAGAILALNLLLGWTLLGWIAALVWALTRPAINRPA